MTFIVSGGSYNVFRFTVLFINPHILRTVCIESIIYFLKGKEKERQRLPGPLPKYPPTGRMCGPGFIMW